MTAKREAAPRVWHVGGEDVDLRIPLLERLAAAGFDVAAVGSGSAEPFAAARIPFFRYDLAPGLDPLSDLRARGQLRALVHRERPDIVHAFDTKPGLLAPDAARRCDGVRVMRTIVGMGRLFSREDPVARLGRIVYRLAQRRVAAACALTVFQNEDDRRAFLDADLLRGGEHALVRGSGVDPVALRAAAPGAASVRALRRELGARDGPLILMVSRLVESKGVREFVAAAADVRSERVATFVLVGPVDRSERAARDLADEVSASPHVVSTGRRDDVPALLAAADLFVLPTYYREGLPRVLLEAAAMRVPMITTPMPGCRDVVRHEETGLMVAPRSAPALAAAVRRLLDDPALAQRLADAAERRVHEQFSLDRVAADTITLYRKLLA
ncbi:MAG: glycosyltransferase family 4 protein [Planctomycetota bacterium]